LSNGFAPAVEHLVGALAEHADDPA
jgi:hypothetical protein